MNRKNLHEGRGARQFFLHQELVGELHRVLYFLGKTLWWRIFSGLQFLNIFNSHNFETIVRYTAERAHTFICLYSFESQMKTLHAIVMEKKRNTDHAPLKLIRATFCFFYLPILPIASHLEITKFPKRIRYYEHQQYFLVIVVFLLILGTPNILQKTIKITIDIISTTYCNENDIVAD